MDRLLEDVDVVDRRGDLSGVEVTSLALDSRAVEPGALYFCVPGLVGDGHDFAADAVGNGAVALMVERFVEPAVPQAKVAVGTIRRGMAAVSATFYGHPGRVLLTAGVTGTNGKTTVAHLLSAILQAHGVSCGVIGTLQGRLTTPEAPELQRQLAAALDDGLQAVAMEVSSHALRQGRVDGIEFSVAVFTNLSHDHLDYHGSMEEYFAAKASLFQPGRARTGVVNADDAWGRRLLESAPIAMVPFSLNEVSDVRSQPGGTTFTWHGRRVSMALSGEFHVGNALAAATAAEVLGVPDDEIVQGLARAAVVRGRFEVVDSDAPFTVVVDYAHTPDGLRTALRSARSLAASGRVLCLFGCGGDRDRAKRPVMGEVASAGADVVVVTSDNPRSEDPLSIIEQVLPGIAPGTALVVEPDRRVAIGRLLERARSGDVALIAGKGHETTIAVAGRSLPFDDRLEAAQVLARLAGRTPA
ncbi:MAG TPA: UDP-N-acetylmuramoyl-L-alanyl-D-glutamate--2,6-diaminopimelate ligase [Acidimicrobiales bacterium]|nr:UDP-N-acetylmuramoyl-L-alanyl-D-glutamate--2,6-diaminopimelate ligase [Acidimicrobiales bacterium]